MYIYIHIYIYIYTHTHISIYIYIHYIYIIYIMYVYHSSDSHPLLGVKRGRSTFWLPLPDGRGSWKIKKEWKYGAGVGLWWGGGVGFFRILFFSRFIIFTFRNYFTLCKIVLCIWRKLFFSATINLEKKVILSCLKMNLKILHKLRLSICKVI